MNKEKAVVIGAGAVGCAIARELSKYEIDVVVVDKNEDIGGDASKSNSAIIHTGYDAAPGTLESQLVVAANPMYDELVESLDVPFKRIGAILPAITEEQFKQLPLLRLGYQGLNELTQGLGLGNRGLDTLVQDQRRCHVRHQRLAVTCLATEVVKVFVMSHSALIFVKFVD